VWGCLQTSLFYKESRTAWKCSRSRIKLLTTVVPILPRNLNLVPGNEGPSVVATLMDKKRPVGDQAQLFSPPPLHPLPAPRKEFLYWLYFWNEIKSTEKNDWQKVYSKEVIAWKILHNDPKILLDVNWNMQAYKSGRTRSVDFELPRAVLSSHWTRA
jgi:hypothetical protein